jgi:hypothetical protein
MTAVSVQGIAALQKRLAARGVPVALEKALRSEADTIAEDAARNAPGDLGRTVEVKALSLSHRIAYAVGTARRAGVSPRTVRCVSAPRRGSIPLSSRVYPALSRLSETFW